MPTLQYIVKSGLGQNYVANWHIQSTIFGRNFDIKIVHYD